MTILYLDECGEEGFSDTSSEWFILGGAVHRDGYASAIRPHYEAFCAKHRKQPNWHFHFQNQSHSTRRGFIQHMLELEYTLCAVAINKRLITKSDNFKRKYYLYFYAARFLLEAVSHWADREGAGKVMIMFSTRRGLSTENFEGYLNVARRSPWAKDYAKWELIEPYDFHAKPNKDLIGLQVADCYASALGQALEKNDYGMTECCYVRQLSPRIMNLNGARKGTGIKLWPHPQPSFLDHARFNWWNEMD
jgi:hypothetical protein